MSGAKDSGRRKKAGVPKEVKFATKPQIALEQVRQALAFGLAAGPVLADAGYGTDTAFREELTRLELVYCVGVQPGVSVWAPGVEPLPPKPRQTMGRPPTRLRRGPGHRPLSVKALAFELDAGAWREICWREGSAGKMSSRFAAVRARPAHRDESRERPRDQEWLLIEWPKDDPEPTKYWFSTLPVTAKLEDLVRTTKMRWRIERDYQELKQEFGLDHYEGRGWRGFHHHATLCIAAYGFLATQRLAPGGVKKKAARPAVPALPDDYTPRGGRANAASRPRLDRDLALLDRTKDIARLTALPVLRTRYSFVTQ